MRRQRTAVRLGRAVLAVLLVAPAAAACSSETERPSLGGTLPTPPADTGVPEVDAMLARLDTSGALTFTATYDVLRRFGGATAQAVVTQEPPATAVSVGDVYVRTGPEPLTCDGTGACEEEVLEQRLSATVLSSGFWAQAPAAAIRTAMARRVDEVALTSETVGGRPADCVAIPVAGGTDTYCVTDVGVVGKVDTAATLLTLTSFSDAADGALLENP